MSRKTIFMLLEATIAFCIIAISATIIVNGNFF